MDYRKQNIDNYFLYDTPVENIFISEYAKSAPGDYVKVYLLALMYAGLGRDFGDDRIAAALSMEKKQVEEAWEYWEECGLVERRAKEDGSGRTEVEFVRLKEKFFGGAGAGIKRSPAAEKLSDREVSDLFKSIESETGRLLEAKEPEAVASWLKEFGMKPSVILLGYRTCVKNGKSSRYRYVEKILMDWRERGLDTEEKVKDYLADTDRRYDFYRRVFKALGFRRNPTEAEMSVMDSWTDDLGCSIEDVLKACKKTSGISSPSINYINSILVSEKAKEDADSAEENAKLLTAVEDRYEKIREENAAKARVLREKVFTEVPRLRDIMDESRSLGISISRNILKGASGKAALAQARERQQELAKERTALLEENGFRSDALDPIYTCSKCGDTGVMEDGTRCSCYFDRLTEVKNEQRKQKQQ